MSKAGTVSPITVYGVVVLVFMMAMYALEGRNRRYVAMFALGCALSSSYGFASGAWPFGAVEALWCLIAFRRFITNPPPSPASATGTVASTPHSEHGRGVRRKDRLR
jgi:hypothetical protein